MLKGKRVNLRPVNKSDIDHFLKWVNDPEIIQYFGIYLPTTDIAEEKRIENLTDKIAAGTDVVFVIEAIDDNDKPIGNIALHGISPKDHQAEFGIAIGEKSHWGKGYGTEATRLIIAYGFNQLNLHRISSGAYSFNERSLRMQKTVGFKEEGRQREIMFSNGEYHDHIILGLLRNEWKSSLTEKTGK